jgi:hypothetical protein
MRYPIIYYVWIQYPILILYENFHSCDFIKKIGWGCSFKQTWMCEYIKVCWKNTIMWKVTKIVLKILCKQFILYVYQNIRWNEKIFAPKIIQNVPKNEYIFMPKMYHCNMILLECSSKLYFIINSTLHIHVHHFQKFATSAP